jgi:2-methylcitrate dehydratase PrpD
LTVTTDAAIAGAGTGPPNDRDPLDTFAGWLSSALPSEGQLPEVAGGLLFDFCACVEAGRSGMGSGWPGSEAARLAVAAHRGDRDDVHYGTLSHPGGIVWPVVVALGGELDVDGATALRGAVTGYEVIVRLARALGPEHRSHWHVTSTAGTVAASAAAAALLGLDRSGLRTAMAHAASIAGGSMQALAERSPTRLVQRAHAVDSGVACALAAAAGVDASHHALDGRAGLFVATAPGADAGALVHARPTSAMQETSLRLRATCGFGQAAVDAAAELGPVQAGSVTSVRIVVGQPAATAAGETRPADAAEAWWSIPYAVAVTLVAGSPDALEAGFRDDAEVREALRKCRLVPGPSLTEATIELELADGSRRHASASCERRPSDAERLAKWPRAAGFPAADALERARNLRAADLRDVLDGLIGTPHGREQGELGA